MPLLQSVKVMWSLSDDSEYGIVVELEESDTDETIISKAWERITAWIHPSIMPKNKSDLKIKRGKRK